MDYLHYWFTHYDGGGKSMDLTEINRLKRVELIERQIKALGERNAAMTQDAGTDEFGKMIDYLTGSDRAGMQQVFEGTASGSSADVTIGGTSISSLGSMGLGNVAQKINESAEELSYLLFEFQYTLTEALESAYKQLNSDAPFSEFQNRLVQEYARTKKIPQSKVGQSIIQDFLKTNGFKGLPKTSTALEAYLQRLALLAYAIPSYGGESYSYSTGTRSGTTDSIPQFFKIIASKTTGTLNFVRKEAGELAMMKAEADVLADFAKQVQDINTQIRQTGRKMVSSEGGWLSADVTVKSDFDNMSTDKSASNMRLSRGDVEVTVDNSKVSVTYGINVKDQNINRGAKYQNITLVNNTSFVNAYRKVFSGYGNSLDLLYQLAAGHEGGEYSEAILSLYWNEMIDTVVKGGMLDALAGMPQENVIYLSVNGQLFSIADIAQRVLNSEVGGNLAGGADLSYSTLGLNRENAVATNRWVGSPTKNTVYALQRSEAVLPQIQAYLNRAKITIDLKLLTTLIRS